MNAIIQGVFSPKTSESLCQDHLDKCGDRIETLRRNWKVFHAQFVDIATCYETYGKAIYKISSTFKGQVGRVGTRHSENLIQALNSFCSSYEAIGEAYVRSSGIMAQNITGKNAEITEGLTQLRKEIFDGVQDLSKQLVIARTRYGKEKTKYDKACKGAENIFSNLARSKQEKQYNVDIIQRNEEKAINSRSQVLQIQKSLEDSVEDVNGKQTVLEDALNKSLVMLAAQEAKLDDLILKLYMEAYGVFNEQLVARKTQAEIKQGRLEELANITLDIARQEGSRLQRQLERKIESADERQKLLVVFKTYLSEIVATEDQAAKVLSRVQQIEGNDLIHKVHNIFRSFAIGLSKTHIKVVTSTTANAVNQLTNLMQQFDITRLQALATGMNTSSPNKTAPNERALHNEIAEHSNTEAMRLQSIKQILTTLTNLQEQVNGTTEDALQDFHTSLIQLQETDLETAKPSLEPVVVNGHKITFEQNASLQEMFSAVDDTATRFGLDDNIVDDYSCAFLQKFLLQGRLYVTHRYLCFFSPFNSNTIFGRDPTRIVIPLSQITKVEKRINALFFDNAIMVNTTKEEFFFASFVSRDQAYNTITQLIATVQTMMDPEKPLRIVCAGRRTNLFRGMRQVVHVQSLEDQLTPHSIIKYELGVFEIPDASARLVWDYLLSDKAFWLKYLGLRGDFDIDCTDWDPMPPDEIELGYSDISRRTITYTHPVRGNMPFVPKTARCHETQSLYWLSPHELAVESEVVVSGVPFSDCFHARIQWRVTQTEEAATVVVRYGNEYIKDTMFKGKIDAAGLAESNECIQEKWGPLALQMYKAQASGQPPTEELIVPAPVAQPGVQTGVTGLHWSHYVLILAVGLLLVQQYRLSARIDELEARLSMLPDAN